MAKLQCGHGHYNLVQWDSELKGIIHYRCNQCGAWWKCDTAMSDIIDSSFMQKAKDRAKAISNTDYASLVCGGR
jgi:hypothetical protein